VVNVTEATASIRESVDKAQSASGYEIDGAYVSLSGTHLSSLNNRGYASISRRTHGITRDDVNRALEHARSIPVPSNRDIVHVIPGGYVVDGQTGVRDPEGMYGFRLEVQAHIVTGGGSAIENLRQCVAGAGVRVDNLVTAAIAAGNAVLTEAERNAGVVLADIGAGTTDVAVFAEGAVWHVAVLGIGGEYITNDVAIGLRLQPAVAEQIKLQHGHALAKQIKSDERFTVYPFGQETPRLVPRWRLAEIIEARAVEILTMVQQEIKRSGYDGLLPGGVVLSGGTALLPGLESLAQAVLGMRVRLGQPMPVRGVAASDLSPSHAVGVGLMHWNGTADAGPLRRPPADGQRDRLLSLLRAFLPEW
jgi:cell division protein FtsA